MDESLAFLKLVSHEVRWHLMRQLATSDLRVQELVERVGLPQNLISYHLNLLAGKGLVHEHRSTADARSVYYSLDVERIKELFTASEQSLHPALTHANPAPEISSVAPNRVLFLCTHNSARSQMAEALLRVRSQGKIETFSAGNDPTSVHPLAVQAMAEMNIDLGSHRAKGMEEFTGHTFDVIITVCDRVREVCPVFPGDPVRIHWSFPDPAAVQGIEKDQLEAFKKTAVELNTRIGYLILTMRNRAV